MAISTHALTWSATVDGYATAVRGKFQLTHSRGVRLQLYYWHLADQIISTHALTWSATDVKLWRETNHTISTHALTWSATESPTRSRSTPQFQLTHSRGVRRGKRQSIRRCDEFQLTHSRGVRQPMNSGGSAAS